METGYTQPTTAQTFLNMEIGENFGTTVVTDLYVPLSQHTSFYRSVHLMGPKMLQCDQHQICNAH